MREQYLSLSLSRSRSRSLALSLSLSFSVSVCLSLPSLSALACAMISVHQNGWFLCGYSFGDAHEPWTGWKEPGKSLTSSSPSWKKLLLWNCLTWLWNCLIWFNLL